MAEGEFPFPYVLPVDPNIGRRVDHYFVLRVLLGRGGMGAAYLAEHEARAHIKCVIKLMLAELAGHPLAISRYQTETEAVSLLKHDCIVKLQNFGVLHDGQLFMRFEYIEGKSLDRYVAEQGGRLPLRKAAYIIFQLCDALQYAHDCGVIHRDLKPDNLMIEINPEGSHLTERVKILDFGIAKVVASTTEHTGSGVSMGTPRFMAPEQVTNAAAATGRADVFSLAVIFYLVVTGKLPWGAPESDIAIYHKQQTEAPTHPPEDVMLPEVASLVMRALSLVPEDRPTMHGFAIELACAIPAEEGLESGTEILKNVKRSWVTSSPHHAQTLPRPVVYPAAPAVTPVRPQPANDALRDAGALLPNASPSAPIERPGSSISARDLGVTANARPRPLATSPAPAADVAPGASIVASSGAPEPRPSVHVASPVAPLPWRPSTPVLAALPTGLVSQRFAAPEPAGEARGSSVVVASEIEMAAGTPGPQPYAHAELPRVVVSSTQLSELTPRPPPGAHLPGHPEPPPFVVLPDAPRATSRRKLMVFGAAACALLAAAASFAIMRSGTQATVNDSEATLGSTRGPGAASGVATMVADAGVAVSETRPAVAEPPARLVDAGQPVPTGEAMAASVALDAGQVAPAARTAARTVVVAANPEQANPASKAAAAPAVSPSALQAKKTGELAILVKPWALVWLNGKPLNQTPYRETIPVGRYRIRLRNDDLGKDETTTAVVNADKTTTIERKW